MSNSFTQSCAENMLMEQEVAVAQVSIKEIAIGNEELSYSSIIN